MKLQIRIPIIIVTLLASICLKSQDDLNFIEIDSITYYNYKDQKWDNVIEFGKSGLEQGFDYYYLRMRIGIAYYMQEEYVRSINQFQKSLKYNFNDRDAQLYLFSNYKILGRRYEAIKLSSSFSEKTKEIIKYKNPVISFAEAGGGYTLSNNFSKNTLYVQGDNNDTIPGFNVLIGDKYVVYSLLEFNISPAISYTIGINNISIQKRTIFQYNQPSIEFDSIVNFNWGYQNYYSLHLNPKNHISDFKINQNEIYQSLRLQFNNGYSVKMYGNLIYVRSQNSFMDIDTTYIYYVDHQIIDEDPVLFEFPRIETSISSSDSTFLDYLVGINFEKSFSFIAFNAIGSYGSVNGADQYQAGLRSNYYLNSKGTIYGITSANYFYQQRRDIVSESRFIFSQTFGFRILKDLWASAEITAGNLNNVNLMDGFFIYNHVDKTLYKTQLNFRWIINNNLNINIYYNYISYEGTFVRFSNNNDTGIEFVPRDYQTNNLTMGLSWFF